MRDDAVPGVDVLFVDPMDLSVNLGFRFVALGSDSGAVVSGLTNSHKAMTIVQPL